MNLKVELKVTTTIDGNKIELEPSFVTLIKEISRGENSVKIPCIKYIRGQYGLGLKDAKELYEAIVNINFGG